MVKVCRSFPKIQSQLKRVDTMQGQQTFRMTWVFRQFYYCDAMKHITKSNVRVFLHLLRSCCIAPPIFSVTHATSTALSLHQPTLMFPLSPHEYKQGASNGLVAKLGDLAVYIVRGITIFVIHLWTIS